MYTWVFVNASSQKRLPPQPGVTTNQPVQLVSFLPLASLVAQTVKNLPAMQETQV